MSTTASLCKLNLNNNLKIVRHENTVNILSLSHIHTLIEPTELNQINKLRQSRRPDRVSANILATDDGPVIDYRVRRLYVGVITLAEVQAVQTDGSLVAGSFTSVTWTWSVVEGWCAEVRLWVLAVHRGRCRGHGGPATRTALPQPTAMRVYRAVGTVTRPTWRAVGSAWTLVSHIHVFIRLNKDECKAEEIDDESLLKPMYHLNMGNLVDVQERHITNRKCRDSWIKVNLIGLVYCGKSKVLASLDIRVCHSLPALTGEVDSKLAFHSSLTEIIALNFSPRILSKGAADAARPILGLRVQSVKRAYLINCSPSINGESGIFPWEPHKRFLAFFQNFFGGGEEAWVPLLWERIGCQREIHERVIE
ncbi:hypothetical protein J6590_071513 [Homalodisca vitripennis]|nr:hypothetical protein J6590_071513 [Homalodisca vitripennis]